MWVIVPPFPSGGAPTIMGGTPNPPPTPSQPTEPSKGHGFSRAKNSRSAGAYRAAAGPSGAAGGTTQLAEPQGGWPTSVLPQNLGAPHLFSEMWVIEPLLPARLRLRINRVKLLSEHRRNQLLHLRQVNLPQRPRIIRSLQRPIVRTPVLFNLLFLTGTLAYGTTWDLNGGASAPISLITLGGSLDRKRSDTQSLTLVFAQ